MGTKRPHSSQDDGGASSSAPKKHKAHPHGHAHAPHKPSYGRPSKHPKSQSTANPLAPLRTRIRSLKRLLAHDDAFDAKAPAAARWSAPANGDGVHPDRAGGILHSTEELEVAAKHERRDEKRAKRLPRTTRVEMERELVGLEEKVRDGERKRWRGEMIGKWHMVRFFERRRGERRLKAAKREGGDVHGAEVDLNYALYWPLERAYVSLWPKGKGEKGAEEEEAKGDREMWALVERCMAEGTLEDLREGRVEGCGVERPKEKPSKRSMAEKSKGAVEEVVEEAEESDDGFFE